MVLNILVISGPGCPDIGVKYVEICVEETKLVKTVIEGRKHLREIERK